MAEVKGLENLQAALEALPANIEKNFMRGALRAGGKEIEQEAKALVPVKSGKLRSTIRTSTGSRGGKVFARVLAGDRRKGGAFWAGFVERGTKAHEIKPKNRASLFIAGLLRQIVKHPGARASHFMERAAEGRERAAVQAVANYLKDRLARFKVRGR